VSPDGFVVNNLDPPYPPQRLPTVMKRALTQPTIGDRLDAKGVSWRWYAGGWSAGKDAVAAGLMPHHNPFQYVKRIMDTPDGRERIRDAAEFPTALRDRTLPRSHSSSRTPPRKRTPRVFHRRPPATAGSGETVREIMASRYWPRTAVVITYDEGGGWFDHVRPPAVDRFGLGTRVPALIVSPYARRGVVAHGQYEHASVLKFIEWALGSRAAHRARPRRHGVPRGLRLRAGSAPAHHAAVAFPGWAARPRYTCRP